MGGRGRGAGFAVELWPGVSVALPPRAGTGCWRWAGRGRGSAGGEGVVAELGQDVHRLADELAGLGEGGALAVDAFLDLRVVGVVGGAGAGVGLAGLIEAPAQHLWSLPGQVPRRALAVGGVHGDVQPGEPDCLAGGGEPARSALP